MTKKEFKATLEKSGTRVQLPIPFDPHAVWGSKPRHHVTGTVNGIPVRGALVSAGTAHFLTLGAAWRRDCGLDAGAAVDVVLGAEGPQISQLSPDVAAALAAAPDAQAFFDGLATFYRKAYVKWIAGARKPEARQARIAEMIALLQAGRKER